MTTLTLTAEERALLRLIDRHGSLSLSGTDRVARSLRGKRLVQMVPSGFRSTYRLTERGEEAVRLHA